MDEEGTLDQSQELWNTILFVLNQFKFMQCFYCLKRF